MAKSPEEKEIPTEQLIITTGVGVALAEVGVGAFRISLDRMKLAVSQSRKIKDTKLQVEQQLRDEGNYLPDMRSPLMTNAKGIVNEYVANGRSNPCESEIQSDKEQNLFQACRVLEGPQGIVNLYNERLAQANVPVMEQNHDNALVTGTLFVGGAGVTLVGALLAVTTVGAAVRQAITKPKKYPQIII